MSLRIEHGQVIVQPTTGRWNHTHTWYQRARVTPECLNPDTAQRVPGCYCQTCTSRLTDPELVGKAR